MAKTIGEIVIGEIEKYRKLNDEAREGYRTLAILEKVKWDMIIARMNEIEKTKDFI